MIKLVLYSLYWIITVQDIIKRNMILQFTKFRLKQQLRNLSKNSEKEHQQEQTNPQNNQDEEVDNELSVAVVGDKGFWVDDNKFFVADIHDGIIDPSDAKEVNAFDIPPEQLGYMFRILDKINGE